MATGTMDCKAVASRPDKIGPVGGGLSESEVTGFSADGTASVSTDSVQGFPQQSGKSNNHWETYYDRAARVLALAPV